MPNPAPHEVTDLLQQIREGDATAKAIAKEKLFQLVNPTLLELARNRLRRGDRVAGVMNPSDLLQDAVFKLLKPGEHTMRSPLERYPLKDRGELYKLAATMMRHIVVDQSRSQFPEDGQWVSTEPLQNLAINPNTDWLAFHEAMEQLEQLDPRQAQIVDLKVFADLTNEEIAATLETSLATVKREFAKAQAFLWAALKQTS
jgi:RNA polymerase sigma factor (TIGR02999 family)